MGSPNHDEVQGSTTLYTSWQQYSEGRRLSSGARQDTCEHVHRKQKEHIRIGYEFVNSEGVDPAITQHIDEVILARAVRYWSKTLKVHRVTAPLRAERDGIDCIRYGLQFQDWVVASEHQYTCRSAHAPRCGSDGITIPEKYLKSTRVCSERCPVAIETVAHLVGRGQEVCDRCKTLPRGPGASGYDFLAFVTIKDSKYCTGMTQAHAATCVKDQCDRPIFGVINFCLSKISLDPRDTDRQVSTAIHELTHALVFSSHLFGYFRNPDGSPKLPRDAGDPAAFQDSIRWSCSGTRYSWDDPGGDRIYVDLSSAEIIMKFNERGYDSCPCPVGLRVMYPGCLQSVPRALHMPRCVFKLTTPRVRAEAREFFACDWLPGAELENQPSSPCAIVGSHWEERIFMGELMTPGQFGGDLPFVSRVTLAVFEDSGWYAPDYGMADSLVKGVHWGYRQGCAFATERCVSQGRATFPHFWCDRAGAPRCSLSRRAEVQCTLLGAPPGAPEYFARPLVGDVPEADFCPYFHVQISNHVCTDTSSSTFPMSNVNFMREVFGADSRCLESTLHADVQAERGTYEADSKLFASARPGCFKVACSRDHLSYAVFVSDLKGSHEELGVCHQQGELLAVQWLRGQVRCAAPAELCAEGLGRPRHVSELYSASEASHHRVHRGWSHWPLVLGLASVGVLWAVVRRGLGRDAAYSCVGAGLGRG